MIPPPAQGEAPYRFTRRGPEGEYPPVSVPRDQQPPAVDGRGYRCGIYGQVGLSAPARPRHPHGLSSTLVEGHVPVGWRAVRPAPVSHADDDQVTLDHRGMQPAAIARKPVEFLGQRPAPEDPSITVETQQEAVHQVRVHIAGFPVAAKIRPAQPVERDGGMPHIELALPYQPSVLRVETGDVFLPGYPFACSSDHVDPPIQHHGRGPADEFRPPDQILSVRRPAGNQTGFRRRAGLHRPAPVRPVRRGAGSRPGDWKETCQTGRAKVRFQPTLHYRNSSI